MSLPLQTMEKYDTYTLANGLRIVCLPTDSSVSYCGFAVNTGTRDERPDEAGIAHFTEHMIFKGTRHRKSWHILNRMENVGGELNAYTAKEETLIYSVFMKEHLERAVELLSDLVRNSIFPKNEIDREVEVIIDEINSYRDNPAELIYDEFEDLLFSGHPLGHNILGDEKTLSGFNSEVGRDFLLRNYHPGNMVFFYMGSSPVKKVISFVEKYMGDAVAISSIQERTAPGEYIPFLHTEGKETFQAHALIGTRAFDMFDKRRTALYLLNNLLGGPGMNSRLNVSLREKRGYVYTVESSLTSFTDTGVFTIYFGTDPKNIDCCLKLVYKELKRLRDVSLTTSQLSLAKKQLCGQLGVGTDNKESMALGLGKSFLHFNRYDTLSEFYHRIEEVTSRDLLEVANEIFDEKRLSTLIYH